MKSLKFTEWNRGADPDANPVTVHVHVNRVNLGFEDVEDVEPAQTLTLAAADLRESAPALDLYFVKFQRVKSLTFFVEDNAGGADVTAIGGLRVLGKTVATTNMNDFKKQGEQRGAPRGGVETCVPMSARRFPTCRSRFVSPKDEEGRCRGSVHGRTSDAAAQPKVRAEHAPRTRFCKTILVHWPVFVRVHFFTVFGRCVVGMTLMYSCCVDSFGFIGRKRHLGETRTQEHDDNYDSLNIQ